MITCLIRKTAVVLVLFATAVLIGYGQDVTVSYQPLEKNPPADVHKSIVILDNVIYGCPTGTEMYLRLVASKTPPKDAAPKDYKSLFGVQEGQVLRPNPEQPFKVMCLAVTTGK